MWNYPELREGDAVGFPAGTGIAHTFINNTDETVRLLVVGEATKAENKINYPLHPKRNAEMGDSYWTDAPERELGPHDGLPDALRDFRSRTSTHSGSTQSVESYFSLTPEGAFMKRFGPAPDKGINKKLCFTATNQSLLASVLKDLSDLPECHFVKYSTKPKEGMYLGRCFLTDENLLGRLWQEYKGHPQLMCSIQDDDFTKTFRPR